MEESLSLLDKIKKTFDCDNVDVRMYSPLTLAFMGDCVLRLSYEVLSWKEEIDRLEVYIK